VTLWWARLLRLLDSEKFHICGLAGVCLLMHLAVIHQVNYFVFDELYYVPDAVKIVFHRNGLGAAHPSLGKLFIAAGTWIFGYNPWGWRMFSVIFSVVSVILFYLICRRLGGKRTALFAGLLFTFENLTFLHSGLGILDPFFIMFMLLSFLLYLQNRHVLSGASLALSALCKFTGLFGVLVIFGHWLITGRGRGIRKILLFSAAVVVVFFLFLPLTDFLASGEWLNPLDRAYHLTFTHVGTKAADLPPEALDLTAQPWDWVLKPLTTDVYYANGLVNKKLITPTLWALIVPSMIYMIYEWVRNRRDIALFCLLWFTGTYVIWIPLALISGTYTYLFYFMPAVGAVSLAIGFGLNRIWEVGRDKRTRFGYLLRASVVAYLVLDIVVFFIFSPIMTLFAPHIFARAVP
jgi:dolichyl-phosphate-mannose-protein mannosyltransferase